MKILLVHNHYQQPGGEDAAVRNELMLLKKGGHTAELYSVSNDSIDGLKAQIHTALHTPYSAESRDALEAKIREWQPDVVHVHNFFPLLTPSVFDACAAAGVPSVFTLHNFRLICANGLFLRDGKPCEDCLHGSSYQAVAHGCYRDSRVASLPVARMIQRHRSRGTWRNKVTRMIALNQFAQGKFVASGIPKEKISIKPHFVEDTLPPAMGTEGNGTYAVYVGRLSPEKGISTLLRAWRSIDVPLKIVGDGPLRDEVQKHARGPIEWMGQQTPENVRRILSKAAFLVLPSECYENFPVSLAEAYAQGLPILAPRLGGFPELVQDGVTGALFEPRSAEALAEKARWLAQNTEQRRRMGTHARQAYLKQYSPEINLASLIQIYQQALLEHARPSTQA